MLERHLRKGVFGLTLKVLQRGIRTSQSTVKTTCRKRDSIANLENLGTTSEGKVMLAMEPDSIAQQIGAILNGLLDPLRKLGFGLFSTARAADSVCLMLDDIDFGQRYFKDLSLGGSHDIGCL